MFEPLLRELHQIPDDYLRWTPFGMARIMRQVGLEPGEPQTAGGPFEAITDTFRIMTECGLMILVPNIIASLAIGAVLASFATQYAARMWR